MCNVLSLSYVPEESLFSKHPPNTLLAYSNIPELVFRRMKKHCLSRAVLKSSLHHPSQCNFAIPHCQVQPSHWVCCSQYLQEWNKVVLFQVITARLGQEVHKFRSVIVTGLQSSG